MMFHTVRTVMLSVLILTCLALTPFPLAVSAGEVRAQQSSPETYTILMMGIDKRTTEPSLDEGVRPDALGVLHIDVQENQCRLLSIPRDMLAPLPGIGQSKINHAYMFGSAALQTQAVTGLLGITVDHYAAIDMEGFTQLVDAVGGITVQEPEVFDMQYGEGSYIYASSPQHLSGEEALAYSRYRYGPDGDFGRIRRQQQLVRSFLESTRDVEVGTFIPEVVPILQDYTRTSMTLDELISIASAARDTCSADNIETDVVNGIPAVAWDDGFDQELWVVLAEQAEIEHKVHWLFGN